MRHKAATWQGSRLLSASLGLGEGRSSLWFLSPPFSLFPSLLPSFLLSFFFGTELKPIDCKSSMTFPTPLLSYPLNRAPL